MLEADRVVATTMAVNAGSWRVLEKCGLRRVHAFCSDGPELLPGAEHGDHVCELTRTDWASLAAAR
jgi:RimJ/RimL family protein N-acetyltransferase